MNDDFPAEKASLDDLYRAVQRDRPKDVEDQVEHWKGMHRGLKAVVAAIDLHESKVAGSSSSRTSDAYVGDMTEMRGRFEEASLVAFSNAKNVETVAKQMRAAGDRIRQLYLEREAMRTVASAVGGDSGGSSPSEITKRYDEQAQYDMWSYARDAKWSADSVQPPSETSADSIGGGSDGPGSGGPGGSGPGGSAPGGSNPGGSSPRPDGGGHFDGGGRGPQLQTPPPGPAPAPPPPSPAPTVPPPHSGPPPVLPPPSLPPGTKPPLPPGGTKPPGTPPGGKPPLSPGAKPTLPPTRPGTLPSGSKPPGSLPGARPPGSGPRPPQSTVKPVIGSRPGSTGMAPTGTGNRPGTTGVGRPVIGTRSGSPGGNPGTTPGARPAPPRSLIGNNGVVGNGQRAQSGVRVPKAQFGGNGTNRSVISGVRQAFQPGTGVPTPAKGGVNRDTESRYRPEGGDHQWTVDREVVPGVISGGDWTGHDHDPGAVAELRSENTPSDESSVVERLSRKEDEVETSGDFWAVPTGERGVVRPKKRRNIFDQGW